MSKYDICCIGHITLDKIVTPKTTVYMPGGTAFYFAHGISRLSNPNFLLVTSLAESEMKAVDDIRALGLDVDVFPSRNSVYFENVYGENQNNRKQRVLAKADPFSIDYLRDIDAKIYHLGSLLADDFSHDVIKYLSTKGILSVDAQGYLREVRGDKVYSVDWEGKQEALSYIDILKVNGHETEVITGYKDPCKAAEKLAEWGVKEVLLTLGSHGSLIYAEGKFHEIPAFKPGAVVDSTGSGDTYMTGYLHKRSQGADIDEAALYAAAMCTLKLTQSGPFSGTEEDIRNVIENSPRHFALLVD